jgi:uncharacterized protein
MLFRKTMLPVLLLASLAGAQPQQKAIKRGLTPEDWRYRMAAGVTAREVTYYSDGVACYAKMFFPKGFTAKSRTPGVVLGQGWAGTHFSIEKYGARFAERGLVAMVIDYRGWGLSEGFVSLAEAVNRNDDLRFIRTRADVVIKRTRLLPLKMVEDYRNAISYLQGEPGVDRDRIGVWGSSFAGGHSLVAAALDSRVKAVSVQVPAVAGKNAPEGPLKLEGAMLEDAISRARNGQGGEYETGYSTRRMVDVETQQMVAEYRPFRYLKWVGSRPVKFIVAEKEELINNTENARASYELLPGPKDYLEVPGITHFEMYIGEAFEISSNGAADWFRKHLGLDR